MDREMAAAGSTIAAPEVRFRDRYAHIDGLVELSEDTTSVTPGATVSFLSYADLID